MYCNHCGASNPDGSRTCAACGKPLSPTAGAALGGMPPQLAGENIPTYLIPSILTTACCGCLPLGIVAIVYSAQVNGKLAAGDIAGAQAASKSAKMWCFISFGVGIAAFILWLIWFFLVSLPMALNAPEFQRRIKIRQQRCNSNGINSGD